MTRPDAPSMVYTGDTWSYLQLNNVEADFWNNYSVEDMHLVRVHVDSRMDAAACVQVIRECIQDIHPCDTQANMISSELFYVRVHNHILVSVRNDNHRSRMHNRINEYRMDIRGSEDHTQMLAQQIKSRVGHEQLTKVSWFYRGSHGVESANLHIQNTGNVIRDEYYPWLTQGVDAFVQDYMRSDSSVLVLYGPPGTGKTSFLRHLLMSTGNNAMITYDDKVIQDDSFFVDYLTDDQHDVLIVEDADVLLCPREDGTNHIMSKFLNVSDGLIRVTNKKMVFTTNIAQLNKIDSALLRPGRCFAAVNFRELTSHEAERAAQAAGVPQQDWHSRATWSLAEIWDTNHNHVINNNTFRLGFV